MKELLVLSVLVILTGMVFDGLSASEFQEGEKGDFAMSTDGRGNAITLKKEGKDGVIFVVKSPRGIGKGTMERKVEQWPKSVKLRLHVKGLESFRLSNGKVTLDSAVSSMGFHETRTTLEEAGKKQGEITKQSPYWLNFQMYNANGTRAREFPLPEGGYFECLLPDALFKDQPKTISLQWIDFYRN